MGVRGLSSFFEMNPDLFLPYKLHNSYVVIDGSNLVYVLYFNSRLDCIYGGDYDKFATCIRDYFAVFQQCDIKPLVVYDGGYDISDRKLRTTQDRLRQRLSITQQIAKYGSCSQKILPILAHEVFKNVLNEMGIPQTQCDYEADHQIAAIANHFQCPVISQDSDFYIFDITHGFIRADSFDMTVHTEDTDNRKFSYLDCKVYYVNNFLSHFSGIDKAVLPLFGTLIGNDFVNINTFESFFRNIRMPKIRSRKLRVSKRHARMIGLLSWLENRELQDAVDKVLSCLKKKNRESARQLIQTTVESYKKCTTNLIQWLDNENLNVEEQVLSKMMSFTEKTLPSWFVRNFHNAMLPSFLLNAIGLHRAFLPSQVEDPNCPSSYLCSLPIRQVLYGMLMSYDKENLQSVHLDPQKQSRLKHVEEYDRKCKSLQKKYVEPTYHISGFGTLPAFNSLLETKDHHKKLMMNLFITDEQYLSTIPQCFQLLIIILRYWVRSSSPKPKEDFCWAILLCIIYLSVVQPCLKSKKDTSHSNESKYNVENDSVEAKELINEEKDETCSFQKLMSLVVYDEAYKVNENFQKFYFKPIHNHAKPILLDIVHSYSQLQTCLLFSLYLNKLLENPFVNPKFHIFFDGTVVYNITRELLLRPFPNLYISELLGRDSVLHKLFLKLENLVLYELPNGCLERTDRQPLNKRKRRRRCKGKQHSEVEVENSDVSTKLNQDSNSLLEETELCNKFETLCANLSEKDSVDVFL